MDVKVLGLDLVAAFPMCSGKELCKSAGPFPIKGSRAFVRCMQTVRDHLDRDLYDSIRAQRC